MGRIPEHEYIEAPGGCVITMKLFEFYHTPGEVETFSTWFTGQTGIIMGNGESGIYIHDYERWLEHGRMDHQCSYDWD